MSAHGSCLPNAPQQAHSAQAGILNRNIHTMRGSDRLQRLVRSRVARLGLAVALIALSAWAFIPYVGYRISSSAFVNAELVRVTAPIAGRLTRDIPRKGDFIYQPTS
jgi:hypothetical protein